VNSKKAIGRATLERLAAITTTLLRYSMAPWQRAVKALRSSVDIEAISRCSRCHRDLAGDYLIWLERVWCIDCFDRARGGTVVRSEPLLDVRANELGLRN